MLNNYSISQWIPSYLLLKGLCHDCLIYFVNNANCAFLFAMELEKLLVNDKTTVSCQTNCHPSIISNVKNNKNER